MPSDYITIKALSQELDYLLQNGKIDKIYMPEKDEISLSVRASGRNFLLVLSCNPNNPRMHISLTKKENPITAPSFCMHLRKHLTGGKIKHISTIGEDRIIGIDIESYNEMHDLTTFRLIAEMMGRYSNILLVNQNDIITDTLKQVPFDSATKRCLLPSAKYSIPAQTKILPTDHLSIKECLYTYQGGDLAKFLCKSIAGLSTQTAQEIVYMAGIDSTKQDLSNEDIDKVLSNIDRMLNIYNDGFAPCIQGTLDNPIDFFAKSYNGVTTTPTDTLNDAIRLCVEKKDDEYRHNDKIKFLFKAHRSYINKLTKKLAKSQEKLAETTNMDDYKKFGELITCNIYQLSKGDEKAVVQDYYQPDCPMITIPLNVQLTPGANAQAYFKKYNKLKRTKDIVEKQIVELQSLIEYAQSILPSIELCHTKEEIQEVATELTNLGALKVNKGKKTKEKPAQPITYEIDGFVVCVGKNNIQNDKLTFKVASGNDVWIHTKQFHGSHTIIFAEGREIPNNVLQTACEICAYYSTAKQSPSVECDYTQRKNLKRHPSANPGMVLYTVFKSALVTPNEHKEYLAKE